MRNERRPRFTMIWNETLTLQTIRHFNVRFRRRGNNYHNLSHRSRAQSAAVEQTSRVAARRRSKRRTSETSPTRRARPETWVSSALAVPPTTARARSPLRRSTRRNIYSSDTWNSCAAINRRTLDERRVYSAGKVATSLLACNLPGRWCTSDLAHSGYYP